MSQAELRSKRLALAAGLTTLVLVTSKIALAEPCADACRAQHNACRMDAKLLFTPRCDAALQTCISGCFSKSRFGRGGALGHDGMGEQRPRDFRGGPENNGPPEFQGPRGFGRGNRR